MWNSSPSPYNNEYNVMSNFGGEFNESSYYFKQQNSKNDPGNTFLIDMLNNDLTNL